MRFCHCLFYNSINNYPIKPPKSGYNNYNRFIMIGVFFPSVCCMHANEMQYDKGVGSDMTNRVHKPLCTCVTLVSTSITFIQVKTSICLSAPICHTQTMIHTCSYIGFIIIFSAESDSDSLGFVKMWFCFSLQHVHVDSVSHPLVQSIFLTIYA